MRKNLLELKLAKKLLKKANKYDKTSLNPKDSNYSINLFTKEEIEEFESTIFKKGDKPYINCKIREKEIQLKPEEAVRQLYLGKLLKDYGYPKKSMLLLRLINGR